MTKTQIRHLMYFLFLMVLMNSSVIGQDNLRERLLHKAANSHVQSVAVSEKSEHEEILNSPAVILIKDEDWQNNPTVAINRKNPNLIIVGADDAVENQLGMPVYLTDDGGNSWTTFRVPRIFQWDPFGYPKVAADNDGRFYYLYTAYNWANSTTTLFMGASADGVHWKYGLPIVDTSNAVKGAFEYRASLTVDNSITSPYYGRVYTVWMHLDTDAIHSEARMRWSDDHAKTWSPTISLPRDKGCNTLQIHTGNKGEVCIGYSTFGDSSGTHFMLVSKDGCSSFEKHIIAGFNHYPQNSDPQEGLKGKSGIPAAASVSFSLDKSSNEINAVYGTWEKWDSAKSSAALYYKSSGDFGGHWSDSILLGNAKTLDHDGFFPFLSYDASTHETSIIYYSSEQEDSSNIGTTVYRSILSENRPSSAISLRDNLFNPLQCSANLQRSIGDYIGCDAEQGIFAAAWTTFEYKILVIHPGQTGRGDILVYVNSPSSSVNIPVKVNSDRLWLSDPYPNPSLSKAISINFTVPSNTSATLSLFDASGKLSKNFWSRDLHIGSYKEVVDLSEFSSGNYFLCLAMAQGCIEKKL